MDRLLLIRHELSGTQAKLVASALIEIVPAFKDNPDLARRFAELAQYAFNASKAVEALAAEVKRMAAAPAHDGKGEEAHA